MSDYPPPPPGDTDPSETVWHAPPPPGGEPATEPADPGGAAPSGFTTPPAPPQPGYAPPPQPGYAAPPPGYAAPPQPGYAAPPPAYAAPPQPGYAPQQYAKVTVGPDGRPLKSKMAAGLLGIFLGGFGVHRFYLGQSGMGLLMLLLSVLSCLFLYPFISIWGLVEGILILTGSPSFSTDAEGRPLTD